MLGHLSPASADKVGEHVVLDDNLARVDFGAHRIVIDELPEWTPQRFSQCTFSARLP